jgi:hypothetical protein
MKVVVMAADAGIAVPVHAAVAVGKNDMIVDDFNDELNENSKRWNCHTWNMRYSFDQKAETGWP